jgi:hypothetical protein
VKKKLLIKNFSFWRMMIATGIALFGGLGALFFFSGCEKPLDIDFSETTPKQAIYCTFSPDEIFQVYVTASQSIMDTSKLKMITDAAVELYENDVFIETMTLEPTNVSNVWVYISTYKAKASHTYKIISRHPNYPTITAEEFLPDTARVSSMTLVQYPSEENSNPKGIITFALQDDINTENYYTINLNNNRTYVSRIDTIYTMDTTIILGIDSNGNPRIEDFYFSTNYRILEFPQGNNNEDKYLTDQTFNGQNQQLTIETGGEVFSDTATIKQSILIEVNQVGKAYYGYHLAQSSGDNELGNTYKTPQSLPSNIQNGYGIFGAKASRMYEIRVK